MSKSVPPPPDLVELVRAKRGTPKSLVQEMYEQFDRRLKANGGKLVPLTAADFTVPPAPDLNALIRASRANKEKK